MSLCSWRVLESGRQADNLVARIGKAETALFPQIDPRTRDQYLRLLKQFLSWCVTRYSIYDMPACSKNSKLILTRLRKRQGWRLDLSLRKDLLAPPSRQNYTSPIEVSMAADADFHRL